MEVTGFDYIILSTVSLQELRTKFENNLREIWANAFVEENIQGNEYWFFFAENKTMLEEDSGYELNENNQGCFSIIARKLPLINQVYAALDSRRQISHEVRLVQFEPWEYTLVLPALIEENAFAGKVYEFLILALGAGLQGDSNQDLQQRAVQFYI